MKRKSSFLSSIADFVEESSSSLASRLLQRRNSLKTRKIPNRLELAQVSNFPNTHFQFNWCLGPGWFTGHLILTGRDIVLLLGLYSLYVIWNDPILRAIVKTSFTLSSGTFYFAKPIFDFIAEIATNNFIVGSPLDGTTSVSAND